MNTLPPGRPGTLASRQPVRKRNNVSVAQPKSPVSGESEVVVLPIDQPAGQGVVLSHHASDRAAVWLIPTWAAQQ
jgi:hypothetical protein